MTYSEAKALVELAEANAKAAGAILSAYPKGPMGLTPDEIKATPQWRAEKIAYESAASQLRTISAWFVKRYRKEYRAERMARLEAMTR